MKKSKFSDFFIDKNQMRHKIKIKVVSLQMTFIREKIKIF
jgi:hypothetical protein